MLTAVSKALDAYPSFNVTFGDGLHRVYEDHAMAIAVSIEAGLVTPVIADIQSLSIAALAAARIRLTRAVRDGEYTMRDLRGSSFTVSTLGPLGVDSFTPIINPPEVAILGIGRIRDGVGWA